MPIKRKSSQTLRDIFDNGFRIVENTYRRVTDYWDLVGYRGSEKKRHRDEIDERLNKDSNSTFSDTKEYLAAIGLRFGEIPIYKVDDEDAVNQPIQFQIYNKTINEVNKAEETLIQEILRVKDETLTSDRSYDKLQKVLAPNKPRIMKIIKERKRQNAKNNKYFKKYRTRHGTNVDAKKYISYQIKKNFEKLDIVNNTIRVKLSGDGTQIGKRLKLLNVTFTLPDSGIVAKTARGNFTLGCFKYKKECYNTLKEVLEPLTQNLSNFVQEEILINGVNFKIDWYLGGDKKFLHTMMGLDACNSKYCCLYCKTAKEEFYKNDLKSFNDLKRSSSDQEEKLKNVKKKIFDQPCETVEGYKNAPIWSFIAYDKVVFDTLHLALRLPGKLIKLIFLELQTLDSSVSNDLEDLPHQRQFFEVLENIGINNPFSFETSESGQETLILRTFSGGESLLIMKSFDFEAFFPIETFPQLKNREVFTFLFQKFHAIFTNVKSNYYVNDPKQCEMETNIWLKKFLSVFHTKHATPYLHLFVGHLAEFISTFGDVDIFNIQGLEKLNDLTTQQYFRGTNRHSIAVQTIVNKRIRNEVNRSANVEIKKNRKRGPNAKTLIHKSENSKKWAQFKINDIVLFTKDVQKICKPDFSIKLIESAMSILKTNETLILKTSHGISNEVFQDINLANYNFISCLFKINDDCCLMFANFKERLFYFFNPNCEKDKNQEVIFKIWVEFLNSTNNWKLGKTKNYLQFENQKEVNSSTNKCNFVDMKCICIFDALQREQANFKFQKKDLKTFKHAFSEGLRKNSNCEKFCSSCGLNDGEDYYECMCSRKFHKNCMDERWRKYYDDELFTCFFCRQKHF